MSDKHLLKDKLSTINTELKIAEIYKAAILSGCPVAIWSLPNRTEFHIVVDFSESIQLEKVDIEKSNKGFVFSPFSNDHLEGSYFLHADIYFSTGFKEVQINPSLNASKSNKLDEFLSFLKQSHLETPVFNSKIPTPGKIDYKTLVQNGINEIRDGKHDKLVLSRNKKIDLPKDFNPIEKLFALRKSYQNAFCYLLSTQNFGNWMAATPEILISTNENTFETVALAGTQKLAKGTHLNDISWTQKEIEEQAMVSRYIINSFKKIRLREFKEVGPKTVKAGNLAHLKTVFTVKPKEINFPELGTVMLALLHPTSAVCGMPLKGAKAYIKQNEGFDRSLFTGYLGPVNIDNQSNIYVNLRTMQFNSKEALLYAGAGITEDSNPEKEFLETEMKMNTLLNIISKL